MKIHINTKKIKALNPCKDRFDNWLKHYKNWSGDILEFLALPDELVPYSDKLWVTLRVVPQDIREYFAVDMAVDATNAAYYSADAAYYAAYIAAIAAHYDADVIYAADAAADAAAAALYAADHAAHCADADAAAAHAAEAAYHAADAARTAHYDDGAAYDAWEGQCQKALDTLAYLIATHKGR